MAVLLRDITSFTSGTHNLLNDELIPKDAASKSIGWLTTDGSIELMRGRQAQGAEGAAGRVLGEHTGFKTDGTSVRFRKIWDGTEGKVQYLNNDTWTDTITGLKNADVTFSNYSSLAGNFVYVTSPDDGLFKIVTANPGDYADMYDADRNFKGYSFIDKGRMILWNTPDDSTGLYGSWIDGQDSAVYTTVSGESIGSSGSTNYTGTLAFKSGNPTRTCHGVTFTDGTTTLTVDFTGNVEGDSAGSGTVNFMTGAYNITFDSSTTGPVTADYQWEDSNQKGVTDFTKSATRVAGEGFVVRQDAGGDAIKVVISHDGSYFSLKRRSVYQFTLDATDTDPDNNLIRTDVGVETLRGAIGTSAGIMYLNTGNPSKPTLNILQRNVTGDNFITEPRFPQFKFEDYNYDDVALMAWDKYIVVACKENTDENNRLLMGNMQEQSIDVAPYGLRAFAKDAGLLYGGDSVSTTTYELFSGFDDMGQKVMNEWHSRDEMYGDAALKKVKKLRFRGRISPDQDIKVFVALDDDSYQHVGTILGDGDYVDTSTTYAIGTTIIGENTVGGDDTEAVYEFLIEMKVRLPKFRTRKVKFVAQGYGYCSIRQITDFDIWKYEDKLPKKYRLKQNVSLDGETTNMDNPE